MDKYRNNPFLKSIHIFGSFTQVDHYQNDHLQRTMSQMRSINEDVCLYQRPPSTLELNVKVILPWMNQGTDLCPIKVKLEFRFSFWGFHFWVWSQMFIWV